MRPFGEPKDTKMMMEPSEALSVGAEVAVTLTGFTGVVAVFGSGAVHEWSEGDRLRLRLLLSASIVPLGLCLLGLLLLTTDLAPALTWQWCSAVSALLFLTIGINNLRTFRAIGIARMNATPGSNLVFLATSLLGLATCALQLLNVVVLQAFWPFFAQIVTSMLIALLQFSRLILVRPRPE